MKIPERIKTNRWLIPLLLLGVVFITYGYQLFRMGLYWDDWEIVYLDHFNNPKAYWDYFLYARPLTSWIYLMLSPLIGMNPLAWQVVNILLRWAGLVGFWWALRMVWPKRSFEIGWVCLLLAIYPAFTQHSVALTYVRHFACIALFAASLGLNLLAIDNKRWWWLLTITGVFASLLQLITLEYFFGLELLRPLFLWIKLREHKTGWKASLKDLILQWLPYVLVLLIFAGYRFVWYPMVSPNPEANAPVLLQRISGNPVGETIKFANLVLQDTLHMTVDNWLAPLDPGIFELRAKANWLSWGAAALITLICAWWLIKTRGDEKAADSEHDNFSREAVLIGLIGVLAGGIPVWITGRQSIGGPWADRFVMGPMFGAVLLLVAIVHWFSRRRLQQTVLLGVVFAFALSSQMQTVNKYRLSRDTQNDYYWQLAWRAPAIQPGTAVVGPGMPFALVNDLHIGFALNTIYDQGGKSFEAPLWYFRAGGMTGGLVPALKPGNTFDYRYLTAHFKGTTDKILVAEYSYGTSCLHIIAPEDHSRNGLSNDDGVLFKLAKPELINLHPEKASTPPVEIFGPEPEHGWCYAYQQIDSARQEQKWPEAARLYEEAGTRGLKPKSSVEYAPVIQAYLNTDQPEKALAVSLKAQEMDKDQTTFFCSLWKKVPVSDSDDWTEKANTALRCDEAAKGNQP
jgi:hypothetical protein